MKILRCVILIFFLIVAIFCGIYRFKNPEKTETQIFLDMLNGKIFKGEK